MSKKPVRSKSASVKSASVKSAKPADLNPLRLGAHVLIQTVTLYCTGRIVEVSESMLILEDAAWIAETGRLNACLSVGLPKEAEIEPYPSPVAINRDAIVLVTPWPWALPRTVS